MRRTRGEAGVTTGSFGPGKGGSVTLAEGGAAESVSRYKMQSAGRLDRPF